MEQERPYFDVPLVCRECIEKYGPAPYTTFYPRASIYEFSYEPSGKTWRVLFCCEKQAQTFMSQYSPGSELISIIWRRDSGGSSGHVE